MNLLDLEVVKEAVAVLKKGGVIAFPTETSYGLGASAQEPAALEKIYQIKQRSKSKPLLVLISSHNQLDGLVDTITECAIKLMDRFWPGPLTILFKARPGLHWALTGNTGKIGVRLSSHPLANEIVSRLGIPVTATSCNKSNRQAANSPEEVKASLGECMPDYICDGGQTPGGLPSTIVDATLPIPKIVRVGVVDPKDILAECGIEP